MARIRTIKPALFKHEELFDAEEQTGFPLRIAFAGLFTVADREGRFAWQPRTLKSDVLPHDDVDFARVLDALATRGFIRKYRVSGKDFGCFPTWKLHQVINNREADSFLPSPDEDEGAEPTLTCAPRVPDATATRLKHALVEGKGREGERKGSTSLRSVRAKRVPLPELTELTEELRTLASKEGRDAEREFENCRDWCADNAKPLSAARFRRWLRNDFGKPKGSPNVRPNGPGRVDARSVALRIAEAEGMVGDADQAGGSVPAADGNRHGAGVPAANLPRRIGRSVESGDWREGDEVRFAEMEILSVDSGAGGGMHAVGPAVAVGGIEAVPAVEWAISKDIAAPERPGTASLRIVATGPADRNGGSTPGPDQTDDGLDPPEFMRRAKA